MKTARVFLLFVLAVIPLLQAAEAPKAPPTARVVSVEGQVDSLPKGESYWAPLVLGQTLSVGDQIRTGEFGRVGMLFEDKTLLRINLRSLAVLQPMKTPPDNLALRLLTGQLFYSVPQKPVVSEINTPTFSAAIRGTEFVITAAGDTSGRLDVIEGAVLTTHKKGELDVFAGQSSEYTPEGARPVALTVRPVDLVQWCISYPRILTGVELAARKETTARLSEALRAARLQDHEKWAAYLALDPSGFTDAEAVVQAGLLLEVGQVERARSLLQARRSYPPALAQLAVADLAANRFEEAQGTVATLSALPSDRLSVILALSYLAQGRADLKTALALARKGVEIAPDEPLAWARLSEMWLGVGEPENALVAIEEGVRRATDGGDARLWMAYGFTLLAHAKAEKAIPVFQKSIQQYSSLGLAHMGLGLALIRRNQLDAGIEEVQIGALLEPNNATLRSYLGKALLERELDRPYSSWRTDRGKAARKQLELAKLLDPNDPTPHYYEGALDREENRLAESLQSYRKAQDLNDNRAVYRSRLLLDQDIASRSNKLGEVYNDLAFNRQAELSFGRAVLVDPLNYAAYASFPQLSESLRLSNQFKALALAPSNANRVGGLNDFDNVFERDNHHEALLTATSTHEGDWGSTAQVYGNFTNLSYAVGFGWTGVARDGEIRGGINDGDNFQRVQRTILVYGPDTRNSFFLDIAPDGINQSSVVFPGAVDDIAQLTSERYTAGYRHKFNAQSTLVAVSSVAEVTRLDTFPGFITDFKQLDRYYSNNLSFIHVNPDLVSLETGIDTTFQDAGEDSYGYRQDLFSASFYVYPTWHLARDLRLTTGVTASTTENNYLIRTRVDHEAISPKLGLWWDATPGTVVRFNAYQNNITDPNAIRLEPTLLTGFSQQVDLPQATLHNQANVTVQQEITRNGFVGILAGAGEDRRDFIVAPAVLGQTRSGGTTSYYGGAWAEFLLARNYSTALRYDQAFFDFEGNNTGVGGELDSSLLTWQNRFFFPCGLTLRADLLRSLDTVEFDTPNSGAEDGDFWANCSMTYKRPYQDWDLTAAVENINRQAEDLLWRFTVRVKF